MTYPLKRSWPTIVPCGNQAVEVKVPKVKCCDKGSGREEGDGTLHSEYLSLCRKWEGEPYERPMRSLVMDWL